MDRRRFLLATTNAIAAGSIWAILGRSANPHGRLLPGLDEAWAADGTAGAAPGGGMAPAAGTAGGTTALLLAVAHGPSPAAITRAAVDALGGMGRFVSRGARVVVKPNIGWDRTPEQAANTNPEVVAALVKMAFEAGAQSRPGHGQPLQRSAPLLPAVRHRRRR